MADSLILERLVIGVDEGTESSDIEICKDGE